MTKEAKTIMNNSFSYSAITVAIIAGVSLALRSFSFVAFPQGAKIPNWITRLGQVLPYGIYGISRCILFKGHGCFRISLRLAAADFGCAHRIAASMEEKFPAQRSRPGRLCYMVMIQSVFA